MNKAKTSAGRVLLTVCTISFFCFFGSYMRIPVVPVLATSLGADTLQVGMINAAFMLMGGVLSIPSGLISDRVGRRLPLMGGLVLLASSSFLLYFSRTPMQMALIYLMFGAGLSAFSPTLMSYVADFTPPQVLGQAYGWYTMALYSGMTLGPAAGGFLATALGLRRVFLVSGTLISAMLFVAFFFLPKGSKAPHPTGVHPSILPVLKELMRNRRLVACLTATVGGCVGFGVFVTFMPLYIRSQGMGMREIGFVFATQSLANALSRLPAGRLCDRVAERSRLVTLGLALFALALAGFGACRGLAALMAVAAAMGISMGTAFTVVGALIVDVVPGELRGVAMGCYNTSVYAGMMLSSLVIGMIIREAGFGAGFLASGVLVVVTTLLVRFLYRTAPVPEALR